MTLSRLILSLLMTIEPGPARAATFDVADARRALLERDFARGMRGADLTRELEVDFPRDRDFIRAQGSAQIQIKARAFERLPRGYRVTWPDGRLTTFGTDANGTVNVNGVVTPDASRGLPALFDVVARAITAHRGAGIRRVWFGVNRANAAPVDLTNAIVMMAVFTVTVLQKSARKGARAPLLTDLVNHGAEVCDRELFERRPYDQSKTADFVRQLQAVSLLDFNRASDADQCRTKIDEALKRNATAATKLGVTRDDLMNSCDGAARLSQCLREYRGVALEHAVKFAAPSADGAAR